MLDAVRMKDACRICARELCGNQRRWLFHPSAKLNRQVLLSYVLGQEVTRDGRSEFACSKCTFMLDRMYRFDTVIARVEALSLDCLHRLLLEKDRLRQCIGTLYRKNNAEDGTGSPAGPGVGPGPEPGPEDLLVVDFPILQDVRYSDMIQDDLAYSVYESWAEKDVPLDQHVHPCSGSDSVSGQKPRRCRGCAVLRVADSDYEAVCKVPRRLGRRSTSCGPPTTCSSDGLLVEDTGRTSGHSETAAVSFESSLNRSSPSPASSVESLDTAVDVGFFPVNTKDTAEDKSPGQREDEALWDKHLSETSFSGLELLGLLAGWEYRPVKTSKGSKLPVLDKAKLEAEVSWPHTVSRSSPCGGTVDSQLDVPLPVPVLMSSCPPGVLQAELAEMEEHWVDDYVRCGPFHFQQKLIQEQRDRLVHYEDAAAQCVGEIQKTQDQVQGLQDKIRQSETRNQSLQRRLSDMELELRSTREEAQRQENNVQDISETLRSKEAEAAELLLVIEEQNKMLCSLKEINSRTQVSGSEGVRGQGEVLALQASLFQAQLELQAQQRAQRQATRTQEDQSRAVQRLERDLQGALQHRRDTEKHNQELQSALEEARSALREREEQLGERERVARAEKEESDRTARELRTSLQTKERLLQDHCDLFERNQNPHEKRDALLQKLRQRIRERDTTLERAVDEKFRCLEEKEEETRGLQLVLREKERDLERQRCVLDNNQETISTLEVLLRGKTLELEQVGGAYRSIQQQQQDGERRQSRILRERDAVISQLQGALHARTQEAEDLRSSLLAQIQSVPSNILEELKVRFQLKDRLFQEVLADRTLQTREHQEQVQDLLNTISSRDQYVQEAASRFGELMSEQAARLRELRKQLSCSVQTSELRTLQEELRLALRRQQESEERSRTLSVQVDSLIRTLHANDDIIGGRGLSGFQSGTADLSDPMTPRIYDLRESVDQQVAPAPGGSAPQDGPEGGLSEFGGGHQRRLDVCL